MPTETRSPEAVKRLKDDEGMPFQLTKFRAGNNEDLFLSFCLKIGIANVSGPYI